MQLGRQKLLNLNLDLNLNIFMGPRNFREYRVWQDAVEYASLVYNVTDKMPWFEKKGLCDQLQRAVVSISSNIAEGAARSSSTEFIHFLNYALGSAFEVETQLLISKNIGYLTDDIYSQLSTKISSIERQLNGLISSLRNSQG